MRVAYLSRAIEHGRRFRLDRWSVLRELRHLRQRRLPAHAQLRRRWRQPPHHDRIQRDGLRWRVLERPAGRPRMDSQQRISPIRRRLHRARTGHMHRLRLHRESAKPDGDRQPERNPERVWRMRRRAGRVVSVRLPGPGDRGLDADLRLLPELRIDHVADLLRRAHRTAIHASRPRQSSWPIPGSTSRLRSRVHTDAHDHGQREPKRLLLRRQSELRDLATRGEPRHRHLDPGRPRPRHARADPGLQLHALLQRHRPHDGFIDIRRGDGWKDTFNGGGDGCFYYVQSPYAAAGVACRNVDLTWTLMFLDQTKYDFDANGRLTKIREPAG